MKKSNRIIRVCVAAALAGWSASGYAAGFALMEQNASGLGNAYSGQAAAAENASTIFFNPAGMTRLPGAQASGVLNMIRPSAKLTASANSGLPAAAGAGAVGTSGGDAGATWSYVPQVYLSYQLSSSLWVGLGVSTPFGLKTQYDYNFVGRFQSRQSEIKSYDINPSVAYKVNDWLSVGGGLSYQHLNANLKSSANIGGAFEGSSNLDASDNQWGYNLGAMFNLGPSTRLGVSYRSVMSYELKGTVQVIGPIIGTQTPSVSMNVRAPDTWSGAISHSFNDQWQVLGDFTWTNWSTIKDVPVVATSASALGAAGTVMRVLNFQFKDSYRMGVGANYKWNESMMLKLGLAYDYSPVTDAVRLTALPDNNRTWLSIGGKYRVTQAGVLDFGYAHIFVKNGTIAQAGGTVGPTASGNVFGTYKNKVDIVSLQYTHSF
jgi:long-chain fatty acid transport protein